MEFRSCGVDSEDVDGAVDARWCRASSCGSDSGRVRTFRQTGYLKPTNILREGESWELGLLVPHFAFVALVAGYLPCSPNAPTTTDEADATSNTSFAQRKGGRADNRPWYNKLLGVAGTCFAGTPGCTDEGFYSDQDVVNIAAGAVDKISPRIRETFAGDIYVEENATEYGLGGVLKEGITLPMAVTSRAVGALDTGVSMVNTADICFVYDGGNCGRTAADTTVDAAVMIALELVPDQIQEPASAAESRGVVGFRV